MLAVVHYFKEAHQTAANQRNTNVQSPKTGGTKEYDGDHDDDGLVFGATSRVSQQRAHSINDSQEPHLHTHLHSRTHAHTHSRPRRQRLRRFSVFSYRDEVSPTGNLRITLTKYRSCSTAASSSKSECVRAPTSVYDYDGTLDCIMQMLPAPSSARRKRLPRGVVVVVGHYAVDDAVAASW